MELVDPPHGLFVIHGGLEVVRDPNSPNDEYPFFLLYLAHHVTPQTTVARGNLARLQRASEGTRESASGGRNHVVEGRGDLCLDVHSVVCGDRTVDPELHRVHRGREIRTAERALHTLDPDVGGVYDFAHRVPHRFGEIR